MKTTKPILILTGIALLACVVFLNSCSKSSDPAVPTASFTYVATGKSVAFTSTSTNATTYSWDFGDGSSSTDANPVHAYDAYGAYTVKLTAKGAGGTVSSLPDLLTLAKTSAVVIDGTLTEWASIAEVEVPAVFGTITKVKVDYDALNLYFYVEGTAGLGGFTDVYLNTDGNPHTGYFSGWYPKGYGADFLIEGDFSNLHDAELFKHDVTADSTAFTFPKVGDLGAGIIKSSSLITVGTGKAYEFSVSRAAFTDLATAITFAIVDVDGNYTKADGSTTRDETATWVTLGSFPKDSTPDAKLAAFDLTK